MWKGAVGPRGAGDASWHWSTPSFYYSREERRFYSRGAFREQQGRGMGHIGDLEMTYATHEWNCGELLDQGGLLRGKGTGKCGATTRGGGGEGAGERAAGGDVQDTRMSERTLTALVCMCGTSGCANSVFVLSAWRCMPCEQGETTRARGSEQVVSQGTSE